MSSRKYLAAGEVAAVGCLIALVFAACGGPDVGVGRDEILLGTWAPLSGPASATAVIAHSMDAYFRYVNDEGGVHGRRIRLIIKDDQYNPERTQEAARELVEQDEVFALVGGIGTAGDLAVRDYLTRKLVPWIVPGSGSRVWTMPMQGYIFSIFPPYVTEGRILARYTVDEVGAKKIGLFYQDDAFGREGQEGVRLGLRDAEQDLAVSVPYAVGATDFSAEAQKLKEAEVDALLIWAIPEAAAHLVGELAKLESRPQILAGQVLSDPVMFELAGENWNGAIVASGVPDPNSDEPAVQRARAILAEHGPEVPFGSYALMGMNWAALITEGMRRAGPELTRPKLIFALESMENWEDNFLGRPVSFSQESHQGLDAIRLMKAEEGAYVSISDWLTP